MSRPHWALICSEVKPSASSGNLPITTVFTVKLNIHFNRGGNSIEAVSMSHFHLLASVTGICSTQATYYLHMGYAMTYSTKHLPGDQRRASTIETVIELAAEQNPEKITTTAIAKRMGLSQGALFRHFPNKDAILDSKAAATMFVGIIQGLVMQSLLTGSMDKMHENASGAFKIYRRGIVSAS